MSFSKLTCVLFLSILMSFCDLFGQESSGDYNFVPVDDNLTQSAITSIFKDSEGFIWIATYGDGLLKYNSIDFKTYSQEQNSEEGSLNSSVVHTTYQDSQKNIWVGTEIGLNLYNS